MSGSFTTSKMAQRHEEFVAQTLGGRQTRGSGNQWRDQTDGKHDDDSLVYRFAWDGKATLGASIGVSQQMWLKVEEQAEDRLPAIPLRFYADRRLTRVDQDLIVLRLSDFADILADAEAYHQQEGS